MRKFKNKWEAYDVLKEHGAEDVANHIFYKATKGHYRRPAAKLKAAARLVLAGHILSLKYRAFFRTEMLLDGNRLYLFDLEQTRPSK